MSAQRFSGAADYPGRMGDPDAGDRRSGRDRRGAPRVMRCTSCQAHLTVDRRGNHVQLFSAAAYRPRAVILETPPSGSGPVCPACGAPLKLPRRS